MYFAGGGRSHRHSTIMLIITSLNRFGVIRRGAKRTTRLFRFDSSSRGGLWRLLLLEVGYRC